MKAERTINKAIEIMVSMKLKNGSSNKNHYFNIQTGMLFFEINDRIFITL